MRWLRIVLLCDGLELFFYAMAEKRTDPIRNGIAMQGRALLRLRADLLHTATEKICPVAYRTAPSSFGTVVKFKALEKSGIYWNGKKYF